MSKRWPVSIICLLLIGYAISISSFIIATLRLHFENCRYKTQLCPSNEVSSSPAGIDGTDGTQRLFNDGFF